MARVLNFSAGPSALPEAVLQKAADEMLDWQGTGQSVMEMSHRSKAYESIIKRTEALLRDTLRVPEDYHVLFLQGGASLQFHTIPLNFLTKTKKADYVQTGAWSQKARSSGTSTSSAVPRTRSGATCPRWQTSTTTPTTSTIATTTPSRAPSSTRFLRSRLRWSPTSAREF